MKVLIVSPHPDDETLGAGGTLFKMKDMGNQIYWLNVTNVDGDLSWEKSFVLKRKKQIKKILGKYQFDGYLDLGYSPCSLENIDKSKLIGSISEYFEDVKPTWVILPNPGDAHSDHKVVYEACMACTKIFRYPFIKKITIMEIVSETEFNKNGEAFSPNYYVDITNTLERKLETMKIYDTEIGKFPFPRSIENVKALATVRGATSGVKYAEAFRIVKLIE